MLIHMKFFFSPEEFGSTCDNAIETVTNSKGFLFTLVANNVLHLHFPDHRDEMIFDLGTLTPSNFEFAKPVVSDPMSFINHDDILYISYKSGNLRTFDLNVYEICEFFEHEVDNYLRTMFITSDLLNFHHQHCPYEKAGRKMLFAISSKGSFVIYCANCFHFISSWFLDSKSIIQIAQVPKALLMVSIDKNTVSVWNDETNNFNLIHTINFDIFHMCQMFTFINDEKLVIGMDDGIAEILNINLNLKSKLSSINTIKLHQDKFSKIISSREILKIEKSKALFDQMNMDNYIISLGNDNTFTIADVNTGIIQYQINTPIMKFSHSMTLTIFHNLYIVLSIDQQIRLFQWPKFVRQQPSTPCTLR